MPAALDQPYLATAAPAATGLVPLMRYRDVAGAAEWLCRAFGFERHAEVPDDAGGLIYAQLKCGSGLIMLVPVGRSDLDALMCQPDEAGGLETQACYVVVADVAAHIAAAEAAGAEIVLGLTEDGSAPAGYTCRDPEGHVWSFGVYDPSVVGADAPAHAQSAGAAMGDAGRHGGARASRRGHRSARTAIAAALLIALAGSAAVLGTSEKLTNLASQWVGLESATAASSARDAEAGGALAAGQSSDTAGRLATLRSTLEAERTARAEAEHAATLAHQAATAAETRRIEAEEALARASNELAVERRIREAAERAHHNLVVELEKEKGARTPAESALAADGRVSSVAPAASSAGSTETSAPSSASPPEAKAPPVEQKNPAETGSVGTAEPPKSPSAMGGTETAEPPKAKKPAKTVKKPSGQSKVAKKPPKYDSAGSPWTTGPF